jgi:hypothetical protein
MMCALTVFFHRPMPSVHGAENETRSLLNAQQPLVDRDPVPGTCDHFHAVSRVALREAWIAPSSC